MRGVKIVSDSPVSRSAALEDVPNAETLAAMKEAESGHDPEVRFRHSPAISVLADFRLLR